MKSKNSSGSKDKSPFDCLAVKGQISPVRLAEIKEMASKTLLLLQDEQRAEDLAEKAYNYCIEEFSLKVNTNRLITAYRTIISDTGE